MNPTGLSPEQQQQLEAARRATYERLLASNAAVAEPPAREPAPASATQGVRASRVHGSTVATAYIIKGGRSKLPSR